MRTLELALGVHARDVYSNQHSSAEVTSAISNYKPMLPNRLWNEVAEFTRSAVTDCMPSTPHAARMALTAVSRLAVWSVETACMPLERDAVLDGQLIDAYIARGLSGVSKITRHNYRLRLLRVAAELENFEPARRDARKRPQASARHPYTASEIIGFRSTGATRTTARQRHNWMVLLTFGAGCGLSSTEIVLLEPGDITPTADGILVTVRGHHPRTVTCLRDWEGDVLLRLGSPLIQDHLFITGQRRGDQTLVAKFLFDCTRSREHFVVDRLRSTWIVNHLRNAPVSFLPQLMAAYGSGTTRSFERFLPFLEQPDQPAVATFFRGATRDRPRA
jgi:integrase